MTRLEGKTALITGAARGLGAQIARRFSAAGAHVIINDMNLAPAKATAAELGGDAVACDVSDPESVAAMFAEVGRLTDQLDILVNNAGISGIEGDNDARERIRQTAEALARGEPSDLDSGITEVTTEQWRRMIAVHLDGTFFCSREAVRLMKPRASGNIINMGSIMGTFGRQGPSA